MTKSILHAGVVSLVLAASAWSQTPAGDAFLVNTYTTTGQYLGRVAMEPDGDFVVVWQSDLQDGDGFGIVGQRFDAAGVGRGGEFQVNTVTAGYQVYPTVAVGRAGGFVVAWQSGMPYGFRETRARRYDSSGSPVGSDFVTSPGFGLFPSVAAGVDSFVVSWTGSDGDAYGVGAQRLDASGVPVGNVFLVNAHTTGVQMFPAQAFDQRGNFVAVWVDYDTRDGSGAAIFGRRFDSSSNPIGGEFAVNTYGTGRQRLPSVSVSPTGGFAVTWSSDTGDGSGYATFARRFDAVGNGLGQDFIVNTTTAGDQLGVGSQVARDGQGNFNVVWHGPSGNADIFVQRFSSSGARRGTEWRVNAYTTGSQGHPSIASDLVGNFVVTWWGDGSGDDVGVFAQRFGGLSPAALTVDTVGNRVLEPGETVDVRPSWRNYNGMAQTFGGALISVTGPAGPTYLATDPVADYGTVPDASTRTCADCYAVSVSNSVSRPAAHWDAAAVETVVPDSQGQQKEWVLHVGSSFTDVTAASGFYRFVETLLHHGVTGGCTTTTYCPGGAASRAQMAVFVLVAKEKAGYLPPACGANAMFADMPAWSPFCRWVEELARRGVVGGCGGGNYCPSAPVTREAMAVFVLRALDPALTPPPCGTPRFPDVPASSPFCPWIEELARRAIVTGCGSGNYCPAAPVTREQMGVFIAVTFGLTLYGP